MGRRSMLVIVLAGLLLGSVVVWYRFWLFPPVVRSLYARVHAIPLVEDNPKSRASEYSRHLFEEVAKLSEPDRREILRAVQRTPDVRAGGEGLNTGWVMYLGETLVLYYIGKGDRERLLELLRSKDLTLLGSVYLEAHLAAPAPWGWPNRDGILVLLDACEDCASERVRRANVQAARRAFAAERLQGAADAEYVRACREWFLTNREHLKFNDRYLYTYDLGDFDEPLAQIKNPVPLFVVTEDPSSTDTRLPAPVNAP